MSDKLLQTWGLTQRGDFKSAIPSLGESQGEAPGERISMTISRHIDKFFYGPGQRWRPFAIHVYSDCLPASSWRWQKPGEPGHERFLGVIGINASSVPDMAHRALLKAFEEWYRHNNIDETVKLFEQGKALA